MEIISNSYLLLYKSNLLEMQLKTKGKTDLLKVVQDISTLAEIYYVRQKEPLGLGHAVYCAHKFINDEPFAVLLGDDIVRSQKPCLKQLMDLYEEVQTTVLGVKEVTADEVDKYGILDAETIKPAVYRVNDLVEKPRPEQAPSRLAVMGRYIINPGIFEILEKTGPGAGGEIQLTDALRVQGQKEGMYALAFEGRRYDVGDKLGYLKATVEIALERPDLSGVFAQYLKEIVKKI